MILKKINLISFRIPGKCIIDDSCSSICELCGKENIKFNYEIESLTSGTNYWLGSECIKSPDLLIPEAETTESRIEKLDNILEAHYESERNKIISNIEACGNDFICSLCQQYKTSGGLSYKQAAYLMKYIIQDYDVSCFSGLVRFSNKRYSQLPPHLRDYILPWFTTAQRNKIIHKSK